MSLQDLPEKIRPFVFHGMNVKVNNKESRSDCPFCNTKDKFYINTKSGKWNCKVCTESGNIFTFLTAIHKQGSSTIRSLKPLAENRGLQIETLKTWGIVKSPLNDDYIIPMYNAHGKIANLGRILEVKEKVKIDGKLVEKKVMKVYGTAGCKLHPFGTQLLTNAHTTRFVTEGPWDGMALYELLAAHRLNGDKFTKTTTASRSLLKDHGVLATPGCSNFDQSWFAYFASTDTTKGAKTTSDFSDSGICNIICYDNDWPKKTKTGQMICPGRDGTKRIAQLASNLVDVPSIKYLRWGPKGYTKKLDNGYDLRDLIRDKPAKEVYDDLKSLAHKLDVERSETVSKEPTVIPIPRDSFLALCKDYQKVLHFSDQLKDSLAICLAVVLSTELEGDQLFLRLIGPAGSGKSTLAEAISAATDYCFPTSIQTGFHSGFTGGNRNTDASLIPRMDKKTVIIKDADTLITAPGRERILGELRDIWDGVTRSNYRNRISREYEGLKITFILCGTDTLRELNRAVAGERFLDCEIIGKTDTRPYVDRALDNTIAKVFSGLATPDQASEAKMDIKYLKQTTVGFIQHLKETIQTRQPPEFDAHAQESIKALATVVGYVRTRVCKEKDGPGYRPRIETPTRLTSQLAKLAICLALVMDKPSIDEEILRIVKKIATDTVNNYEMEIVDLLAKKAGIGKKKTATSSNTPIGLTKRQVASTLKLSETKIGNLLNDMQTVGIVERDSRSNKSGIGGRNTHFWRLTDTLIDLYTTAMFC